MKRALFLLLYSPFSFSATKNYLAISQEAHRILLEKSLTRIYENEYFKHTMRDDLYVSLIALSIFIFCYKMYLKWQDNNFALFDLFKYVGLLTLVFALTTPSYHHRWLKGTYNIFSSSYTPKYAPDTLLFRAHIFISKKLEDKAKLFKVDTSLYTDSTDQLIYFREIYAGAKYNCSAEVYTNTEEVCINNFLAKYNTSGLKIRATRDDYLRYEKDKLDLFKCEMSNISACFQKYIPNFQLSFSDYFEKAINAFLQTQNNILSLIYTVIHLGIMSSLVFGLLMLHILCPLLLFRNTREIYFNLIKSYISVVSFDFFLMLFIFILDSILVSSFEITGEVSNKFGPDFGAWFIVSIVFSLFITKILIIFKLSSLIKSILSGQVSQIADDSGLSKMITAAKKIATSGV